MKLTRRNWLHSAAAMLAGGAAPGLARAQTAAKAPVIGPEMLTLSDYMAAAAGRALPAEIAEQAKFHILDTLGAIISGKELAAGQAALRYLPAFAGKGDRTVIATRLTASALDAAMANGVMAHGDETDDSHEGSRTHPGASVVPATLAAGEEFGIDGERFLRAVTLGYDIGARVVMAMGGPEFSYKSHKSSHAIGGAFGSAAAASCAAGLDARQMRWMLDYTAQQSSGIASWQRDTDHVEKAFVFAGMPARNGVQSALLVKAGWNGVDDVFSGADNFFMAYAPDAKTALLTDKLGERYEIARTDIKRWTVGSPIQAPLDGVDNIRKKRPFEADDVAKVIVRMAPESAGVVDNRDIPDISLQHMIAVMLLDKTASFAAAHDAARMKDAAVLRQRAKVELVRDESLRPFLPVRVAIVEITLNDGTRLTDRVEAVRGTVRNPMAKPEVIEKVRDLIAPVLGAEKSGKLIEAVFTLEKLADVRQLRGLLQA